MDLKANTTDVPIMNTNLKEISVYVQKKDIFVYFKKCYKKKKRLDSPPHQTYHGMTRSATVRPTTNPEAEMNINGHRYFSLMPLYRVHSAWPFLNTAIQKVYRVN